MIKWDEDTRQLFIDQGGVIIPIRGTVNIPIGTWEVTHACYCQEETVLDEADEPIIVEVKNA